MLYRKSRASNRSCPLCICWFSFSPVPTALIVFPVVSIQGVFVCRHHGGLARCQTPAVQATGRQEQQRPESSHPSVSSAQFACNTCIISEQMCFKGKNAPLFIYMIFLWFNLSLPVVIVFFIPLFPLKPCFFSTPSLLAQSQCNNLESRVTTNQQIHPACRSWSNSIVCLMSSGFFTRYKGNQTCESASLQLESRSEKGLKKE